MTLARDEGVKQQTHDPKPVGSSAEHTSVCLWVFGGHANDIYRLLSFLCRPSHSEPLSTHSRNGFLPMCVCVNMFVCVCVPLDLWFLIYRPIFPEAVLRSAGCRIDGVREEGRGERGCLRVAAFWHVGEYLMVAIKEQMHWPWTPSLKDVSPVHDPARDGAPRPRAALKTQMSG